MEAAQHPAVTKLQALLGDIPVTAAHGETTIVVPAEHVLDVAQLLRDDPELAYNQLADLTAVDRLHLDQQPRFVVVYHLLSHARRERLRLHAPVPNDDDPAVASVVPLWPTADWLEREVYDMFGIRFLGHPDLRRILMPDDWEGHPLRKDYPIGIEDVAFTHTSVISHQRPAEGWQLMTDRRILADD